MFDGSAHKQNKYKVAQVQILFGGVASKYSTVRARRCKTAIFGALLASWVEYGLVSPCTWIAHDQYAHCIDLQEVGNPLPSRTSCTSSPCRCGCQRPRTACTRTRYCNTPTHASLHHILRYVTGAKSPTPPRCPPEVARSAELPQSAPLCKGFEVLCYMADSHKGLPVMSRAWQNKY